MSFDPTKVASVGDNESLNPFGTGQCLSTRSELVEELGYNRLNPFGTGQCLSTAVGC